jgi:fibronectin type 3 domain-containing protein
LRPRKLSISIACVVVALVVSAQALAGFGCLSTETLTISTAVLASPTDPGAAVDTCMPATSVSVQVTWTPSSSAAVSGYAIFRADGGGSATQVGTVSGNSTSSFVDTSAAFSGDYAYSVVALRGQWTSAATSDAALTTPGPTCV